MDKCEKLQLPPANNSEIPNSSDTISRQAAITEFSCCELTPDGGIDANYAIDFLKQLPPARPERIRGHWVNGCCDKCNEHAPFWAMASTYYESNFCPNCGAEMEVTT
jgi:hypothetical protein